MTRVAHRFLGWFIGALLLILGGNTPMQAKELLIQADQLKAKIGSNEIVILDAREPKAYDAGHIPGAIRVPLDVLKKQVANDEAMVDDEAWSKSIGDLGIDGSKPVVVYGSPLPEAARVWWLLKFVGCKDVRLLDGGLEAYQVAGGNLSTESVAVIPQKFEADLQADRRITTDELKQIGVDAAKCRIVDNRTPEEYSGADVRAARGGHIPGAKNSDYRRYLGKDGKFLPVDELRKLLEADGIELEQTLVTHCQSGGRSSIGALVLEMVTGKPARNYDRSWGEWASRSDLPVEK